MPAGALDLARTIRDAVSPARREKLRARTGTLDELGGLVSPAGVVLAGPFEGLRFPLRQSWGGLAARLAGTYEQEIASEVERVIQSSPATIIDAGAAEGYYAVGLARRLPGARVVAYDIDPVARQMLREVVRLNGVRNVTIRGRVTIRELARWVGPGSFLICDVEGYEAELLDPATVPGLRHAYVLVELHDFARPGVGALIAARFGASHQISVIGTEPRIAVPPQLAHLEQDTARRAMDEGRPAAMQWAVMVPRRS